MFIRNLYTGIKSLPLADFWTLRRYFVFTDHNAHPDSLDEPFGKQQLCNELFDHAGSRRNPVDEDYQQLGKLMNAFASLRGLKDDYEQRAVKRKRAEIQDARHVSFDASLLREEERTKWPVCGDLVKQLRVLAREEFSQLDQVGAPLAALKTALKAYFDDVNNTQKLQTAESGNHRELKKILLPLSNFCGAECKYREKESVADRSMWAKLKPGASPGTPTNSPNKGGDSDDSDFSHLF